MPSLRRALCQRRLSYEKARLIARHADDAAVDGWIERATRMSCIGLRRALEGEEDAQMCARGTFSLPMSLRIRGLLAMALRAPCCYLPERPRRRGASPPRWPGG